MEQTYGRITRMYETIVLQEFLCVRNALLLLFFSHRDGIVLDAFGAGDFPDAIAKETEAFVDLFGR